MLDEVDDNFKDAEYNAAQLATPLVHVDAEEGAKQCTREESRQKERADIYTIRLNRNIYP